MIDIKKNSINKISIDIDQYEYYLIEFTSDSNCESVTAIFSNSGFNCDYPIIQIEETVTANVNVLLGKINLPYLGFWSANIYGNIDGVNLDTGLATFLIEEDVRVYRGAQEEGVDNNNYLIAANNLSDVDDVTDSQDNLNVYDKDDVYTKTESETSVKSQIPNLTTNGFVQTTNSDGTLISSYSIDGATANSGDGVKYSTKPSTYTNDTLTDVKYHLLSDDEETASFTLGANSDNKRIKYNSISLGVCTVSVGSCKIGGVVYFKQTNTGKLNFTNGAGVDPIEDSGIIGTSALNDYTALVREEDNGGNEVYTIV